MTRAEVVAYNAGITTALDHARRIAQVIEARTQRSLAEWIKIAEDEQAKDKLAHGGPVFHAGGRGHEGGLGARCAKSPP